MLLRAEIFRVFSSLSALSPPPLLSPPSLSLSTERSLASLHTYHYFQDDPNAHDEFVKINKAYEVLKDENLRKKYDQFGEKGLEDGFQGGNNYQSWQFYNDNFGIYDDDQEIVTLNRADFQRMVSDSNEIWFINFYSTYCSHCHQLAPTVREKRVLEFNVSM